MVSNLCTIILALGKILMPTNKTSWNTGNRKIWEKEYDGALDRVKPSRLQLRTLVNLIAAQNALFRQYKSANCEMQ